LVIWRRIADKAKNDIGKIDWLTNHLCGNRAFLGRYILETTNARTTFVNVLIELFLRHWHTAYFWKTVQSIEASVFYFIRR
jgi:hypothetical protein